MADLEPYLQTIEAQVAAIRAAVATPAPTVVHSGGNLQAALDAGGLVQLEDGAIFQGNYVLRMPGTRLMGPSAALVGNAGAPALKIPPGARDVQAVSFAARRSRAAGWRDSPGYAIVLTPKYGTQIQHVLLEDVDMRDVSSVLNLLGYDYVNPSGQTTDVTFRRVTSVASKARFGGDGRMAQIGSEPAGLTWETCAHEGDGSSTIYCYRGDVKLQDGTSRAAGPIQVTRGRPARERRRGFLVQRLEHLNQRLRRIREGGRQAVRARRQAPRGRPGQARTEG